MEAFQIFNMLVAWPITVISNLTGQGDVISVLLTDNLTVGEQNIKELAVPVILEITV